MNNEAVCRLAPATMRKNLKRLNRRRKKVLLVFIKVDKGDRRHVTHDAYHIVWDEHSLTISGP